MAVQFDIVVIGGGSAGVTAATEAARLGARTALVERSGRYGGTCRYVGCMPSKVLLHTAQTLHAMRHHAAKLGLPSAAPALDFAAVMRHKDEIIRRVGGADGYGAPSEFYAAGGRTFTGEARFWSQTEAEVGDELLRAERWIIATGSRPRIPPLEGLAECGYLTWETIFDLQAVPQSLIIIGGGPLAIEFSQMFRRFGSEVTVLEVAQQVLPQADETAAGTLREILAAEGVRFQTGVNIRQVRRDGDTLTVTLDDDHATEFRGSHLLVATGTQPNSDRLNLQAAGVELTDGGSIKVDAQLRTTAEGIYACGDVATTYQFTHIASYEAKIAVANSLHDAQQSVDERVVPWAVYTEPTLAHVGLTEREAREQNIDVVVTTVSLRDVERGLLVEEQRGVIKAVAARVSGELLGVDIVSPRADDLLHEAALAIQLRRPAHDIARTIHAYPTFSQGLQQAAQQLMEQLSETKEGRHNSTS